MTKSIHNLLLVLWIALAVVALLLVEYYWGDAARNIIGLVFVAVIGPMLWQSRNRDLKDWRYRLALGLLVVLWALMLAYGITELISGVTGTPQ